MTSLVVVKKKPDTPVNKSSAPIERSSCQSPRSNSGLNYFQEIQGQLDEGSQSTQKINFHKTLKTQKDGITLKAPPNTPENNKSILFQENFDV